jgi:sulfur carrier protein ThiS
MSRSEKITVWVEVKGGRAARRFRVGRGCQVGDLLRRMGLLGEEFIAVRRGMVVAEFEPLKENDRISLIKVFSGG